MIKEKKYAHESKVVKTELLLPNDTNTLNTLFGGQLMHWMDIIGGISAQKHSNSVVVTAAVDHISFDYAIPLGQAITLEAQVTRAFNTSMEVFIRVWAEDFIKGIKKESNTAFFTFVALDENKKSHIVPELTPQTEEEIKLYKGALDRRKARLRLAKKNN